MTVADALINEDIPMNLEISSPPEEIPIQTGIECSMCDRTYTNMKSLSAHKRRYHKEKQRIDCLVCKKVFANNNSLRAHKSRFHKDKSVSKNEKKDISEQIFELALMQNEHSELLKKNLEIVEKLYTTIKGKEMEKNACQCEICMRTFKNTRSLATHRTVFHKGV